MKMKKRIILPSIVFCVLFIACVCCSWYLIETVPAARLMKQQCDRLTEINNKSPGKMQKMKAQILESKKIQDEQENERLRWVIVYCIYGHYKDSGSIYKWYWITPELIYKILCYEEKYRPLTAGFNFDTLNPKYFSMCFPANETNFCDDRWMVKKNNAGLDYWIFQMNECHYVGEKNPKKHLWRRVEAMFPELKNKPDWDVEKNTAVWSMWMGEQKTHSVWYMWNHFRPDVKELYWKLKQIK